MKKVLLSATVCVALFMASCSNESLASKNKELIS